MDFIGDDDVVVVGFGILSPEGQANDKEASDQTGGFGLIHRIDVTVFWFAAFVENVA